MGAERQPHAGPAGDEEVWMVVRTLREVGDKASSEDKADVETKVAALRETLKGNDIEAIRSRMTELIPAVQRVSTAAYQASEAAGGPSDGAGPEAGNGSSAGAGESASPETEEAVEGEFKEV